MGRTNQIWRGHRTIIGASEILLHCCMSKQGRLKEDWAKIEANVRIFGTL